MQEAYLVTKGSYSGYSVVAVFLNKSEAEEYHQLMKKTDSETNDIEVYPIGAPTGQVLKQYWLACIRLADGALIDTYTNGEGHWEWVAEGQEEHDIYGSDYPLTNGFYPDDMYITSYKSQDHANKLAVEARQGVLRRASEMGITIMTSEQRRLKREQEINEMSQGKKWYKT
jgi:hypothetical protein